MSVCVDLFVTHHSRRGGASAGCGWARSGYACDFSVSDVPERTWPCRPRGRVRAGATAQRDVLRARIVLAAAEGRGERPDRVRSRGSSRCRAHAATPLLRRWLGRSATGHDRDGPPLACWLVTESAVQATVQGLARPGRPVSLTTVRRWLAADASKPWPHRSWILRRAPDLTAESVRSASTPSTLSPPGS